MKTLRSFILFLVLSLTTNTVKSDEDFLKDLGMGFCTYVVAPAIAGITYLGGQMLYTVVVDKYFPSEKTKQETETAEDTRKSTALTLLKQELDMVNTAYPDRAERDEVKEAIQRDMRLHIGGNVGRLTDEEKAKIAEKKAKKSKTGIKKPGLISKFKTNFLLAAESAGKGLDAVADKSVAHITKHDSFKDTFVEVHAKMINRGLVGISGAVLLYGMYKLYNKYTNDDYDVYDNDADDDDNDYDDE